jgi:hypothetical protein
MLPAAGGVKVMAIPKDRGQASGDDPISVVAGQWKWVAIARELRAMAMPMPCSCSDSEVVGSPAG